MTAARGVVQFHEVNDVPYGVFSILSPHPIIVRHVSYPSAHIYYLCQKYQGSEYEHTIRQAQSLWEVDRYVRRAEGTQREDWESVKVEVMLLANYYKFKQNSEAQALLLGTGSKVIINHTAGDSFWGDGGDGTGKNIMGVILMSVRKRLQTEEKLKKRAEAQQKQQHQPPQTLNLQSAVSSSQPASSRPYD
eukprot:Sspe_Gene.93078::Locus_65783_Transcript_1_1_Confidence_1.000_Length_691::g.93078::m.93078/K09935/K09935; uncharacterized protein